jgi:hypothetical protein
MFSSQLCVIGLALCVLLLLILRFRAIMRSRKRTKTAMVVVMGDIGRSPRMLNHAHSLASAGAFLHPPAPCSTITETILVHARGSYPLLLAL